MSGQLNIKQTGTGGPADNADVERGLTACTNDLDVVFEVYSVAGGGDHRQDRPQVIIVRCSKDAGRHGCRQVRTAEVVKRTVDKTAGDGCVRVGPCDDVGGEVSIRFTKCVRQDVLPGCGRLDELDFRRLFDHVQRSVKRDGFIVQNNVANGLICTGESVNNRRFCEGYQTVFHLHRVGYGSEQRVIDVDGDQEPLLVPICGRGEVQRQTRKFTGCEDELRPLIHGPTIG